MKLSAWGGFAIVLLSGTAYAKPPGQQVFCQVYPNAPSCAGGEVACTTCHTGPPIRNAYGLAVESALLPGVPRPLTDSAYSAALPGALNAVDALDSDGDGFGNGEEIRAGTNPADALSNPKAHECGAAPAHDGSRTWDICHYDDAFAYRKVLNDFCGRSPSYEEETQFAVSASRKVALHAALSACLLGEFWRGRDGAVWNMAAPKIKPLQSIKGGADAGPIPLADYEDDFALFVYTQLDNHDARDLLKAQYFVAATTVAPTTYTVFDRTAVQDAKVRPGRGAYQTIDAADRAGMINTRWFRTINTMFTPVPRTTAAQAYRAYLGLDIALLQGLQTASSAEPVDYDNKGVRATGCITCHQTLDPLAYPFSRYEGIDQDNKSGTTARSSYRPDRMTRFVGSEGPGITSVPEAGSIFGKPVANLVAWAAVAADSDDFAKKLVLDYWRLLIGDDPRSSDAPAFLALWSKLRGEQGYSIDKLLHDLIDTEAYGVP